MALAPTSSSKPSACPRRSSSAPSSSGQAGTSPTSASMAIRRPCIWRRSGSRTSRSPRVSWTPPRHRACLQFIAGWAARPDAVCDASVRARPDPGGLRHVRSSRRDKRPEGRAGRRARLWRRSSSRVGRRGSINLVVRQGWGRNAPPPLIWSSSRVRRRSGSTESSPSQGAAVHKHGAVRVMDDLRRDTAEQGALDRPEPTRADDDQIDVAAACELQDRVCRRPLEQLGVIRNASFLGIKGVAFASAVRIRPRFSVTARW